MINIGCVINVRDKTGRLVYTAVCLPPLLSLSLSPSLSSSLSLFVSLSLSLSVYFYLSSIRTPLHYAAASAQYQCVVSLVSQGANLMIADIDKRTPLHYAAAADSDGK